MDWKIFIWVGLALLFRSIERKYPAKTWLPAFVYLPIENALHPKSDTSFFSRIVGFFIILIIFFSVIGIIVLFTN
jgi:hypothetical protein